ncbi:S-layer homology domain-containing protein [Patescibacteria group bacterium]
MKKIRVIIFIIVIQCFSVSFTAYANSAFIDVNESHPYFAAIEFLYANDIINGYQDGTFKPDRPVNRAEFLKLIIETSNINITESTVTPFPDVDHESWYGPYLIEAFHNGWIEGYPDGTFRPENTINRAESIKILGEVQDWNTEGYQQDPFFDVRLSDWFGPYIAYAKDSNFLEETDYYQPDELMTRGKMSEILFHSLKSNPPNQIPEIEEVPVVNFTTGEEDEYVLINTPWSSQAPYGEWADQRQSEACEEVSAIMAVKWGQDKSITKEYAHEEILKISEFLITAYGTAHDSSLEDTLNWIIKGYFNYQNAEIVHNITIEDMKTELKNGNILIIAVNGKKLNNLSFTPPGPLQHTILVKGYDNKKQVFIVNEPGTIYGENYEYSYEIIDEALYDYESGNYDYLPSIREKNMIVIHHQ